MLSICHGRVRECRSGAAEVPIISKDHAFLLWISQARAHQQYPLCAPCEPPGSSCCTSPSTLETAKKQLVLVFTNARISKLRVLWRGNVRSGAIHGSTYVGRQSDVTSSSRIQDLEDYPASPSYSTCVLHAIVDTLTCFVLHPYHCLYLRLSHSTFNLTCAIADHDFNHAGEEAPPEQLVWRKEEQRQRSVSHWHKSRPSSIHKHSGYRTPTRLGLRQ